MLIYNLLTKIKNSFLRIWCEKILSTVAFDNRTINAISTIEKENFLKVSTVQVEGF
ncbi:528_t:CDS:2 [Rhizophagus irregularis]|nr:528_t:CDS:2 [Rhizophagus irregularis]